MKFMLVLKTKSGLAVCSGVPETSDPLETFVSLSVARDVYWWDRRSTIGNPTDHWCRDEKLLILDIPLLCTQLEAWIKGKVFEPGDYLASGDESRTEYLLIALIEGE